MFSFPCKVACGMTSQSNNKRLSFTVEQPYVNPFEDINHIFTVKSEDINFIFTVKSEDINFIFTVKSEDINILTRN